MSDLEMPGGPLATRPLHFIFVLDSSGSMAGAKIASLNHAVAEALPAMQDVARQNPNASLLVRALSFDAGARWLGPAAEPVDTFTWTPLQAGGCTDMGAAMVLLADALDVEAMPARGLAPVIVLVTDGQPTDRFDDGLAQLMAKPWGKKAVRLAIAIGEDVQLEPLRRFIANPEIEPLVVRHASDLVAYIRWASTAVVQAASAPASRARSTPAPAGNVVMPAPPASIGVGDVF